MPVACAMLADWGADVIKVEKLRGGDDQRGAGHPPSIYAVYDDYRTVLIIALSTEAASFR